MKQISSGILITDGNKILCGITPQRTYDIPKGKCEKGESYYQNMVRELKEETNLDLEKDLKDGKFSEIGFFKYNSKKDLFLFMYRTENLPPISAMNCTTYFEASGKRYPEFIGYEYVSLDDIENKLGSHMVTVLCEIKDVIKEGI